MKRDDAIPQLIILDERSKRETLELCGDQQEGLRCTLSKDHAGMHECVTKAGPARWVTPPT